MRALSFATIALAGGAVAQASSEGLPSLIDALIAAGASKFASLIQSDPTLSDMYLSGQVKTVFAPVDEAPIPSWGGTCPSFHDCGDGWVSALASDNSTSSTQQQLLYQACNKEVTVAQASLTLPGDLLQTDLPASGLSSNSSQNSTNSTNSTQVVVTDTRASNTTNPSRRWDLHSRLRRQWGGTPPCPSLLRISAGLGNISNVIRGDIPFDGGLIQLTDSYFTLPVSVSATAQAGGQSTFAGLAGSSGLSDTLDNTNAVTVFLPSNTAFAAASSNATSPAAAVARLISNHLVAGFVGYLPNLKDGATLTTQAGDVLTVSVRDGIWFINNARITQANLILENGVAHVIDQVLTPSSLPVPPVTSAAGLPATVGREFFYYLSMGLVVLALL